MNEFLAFAASATLLTTSVQTTQGASNEWRFDVLLDGKSIGYHRFELRDDGNDRELVSEARFNVKVLFINAYRYEHDDRESWNDECVTRIDARTDDNGTKRIVRGLRRGTGFQIITDERERELNSCVLTFAYWNPRILEATHLLNPQTGEYVPVHIAYIGKETLSAHGDTVTADRYRVTADPASGGKMRIDLWYSPNKDWLALESLTESGHTLRYRIR